MDDPTDKDERANEPSTAVSLPAAKAPEDSLTPAGGARDSEDWLRDFYKECGREITLAYTTLNQMKNWAIVVQGTIIASVAAFGRSVFAAGSSSGASGIGVAIVAGAVLAHLFTLRFMIRSIQCYINLLRWNTLQHGIIKAKLVDGHALNDSDLQEKIQHYYFDWSSPAPRPAQIASMLKLGFGILLTPPVLLLTWASIMHWDERLVRGLTAFAIGGTIIEAFEFAFSPYFDTVKLAAQRKKKQPIFPAPSGTFGYIALWVLNIAVSAFFIVGMDELMRLRVDSVIFIVSWFYLFLYVLILGFGSHPRQILAHVFSASVALLALFTLWSFSWIALLMSVGIGGLLSATTLLRQRDARGQDMGSGDERL